MGKVKLTINELKRQKESLSRFQRYLPTLVLKKQHLQIELNKARRALEELTQKERAIREKIEEWIAVLGEDVGLADIIEIQEVEVERGNVAGIDIPLFKGVRFKEIPYDLHATPFWLDRAIEEIKGVLTILANMGVLKEQISRLKGELRVANQRVNLFEKVMIPRTLENIRMIHVFLGDQQTAAVVRGKIAKGKIGRETQAVRG